MRRLLLIASLFCAPGLSDPPQVLAIHPTASPTKPAPHLLPTPPETLPIRTLSIRLDPSEPWAPTPTDAVDLYDLLSPPADRWPDRPAAQLLLDGLTADEGAFSTTDQDFLDAVDDEGLFDFAPSAYDDEWDRYIALWAHYIATDSLLDDDLTEQVYLSWQRTPPEGDTAEVLAMALLVLLDADEAPELVREVATTLLSAERSDLRAVGRSVLIDRDDSTLDELTQGPPPDPASLRLLLPWALTHAPDAASTFAQALKDHPDATPTERQDAHDVLALLAPAAPSTAWQRALEEEIRACAGVEPGEGLLLTVRDQRWTIVDGAAAADCLQGWDPAEPAPDMRLTVAITR